MAIPFPTTYFIALGTGISNLGVFQECTTYTRPAVNFTGTALSGLTETVAQITGPTGPVGGFITKGAIFDAVTVGNCICYWDWNLVTAVPANFLTLTLNINFNSYLTQALNLSLIGGAGSSGSSIDQGAQIGLAMGNPLIAGSKLTMQSGALVAARSTVFEVGPLGLMFTGNGIVIAHLDVSGNLVLKGTSIPSSTP
jgi:hypothetical protein